MSAMHLILQYLEALKHYSTKHEDNYIPTCQVWKNISSWNVYVYKGLHFMLTLISMSCQEQCARDTVLCSTFWPLPSIFRSQWEIPGFIPPFSISVSQHLSCAPNCMKIVYHRNSLCPQRVLILWNLKYFFLCIFSLDE